jgi:hypothetical protein
LPLLRRPYEPDATRADDYDRRILALLGFGPAATVIVASALSGRGLVTMWGYPLWLFLGPWIVVAVSSRIDRACLTRLAGVWGAVTAVYALAFVAQYAMLPHFDHRYRAVLFPGDRLAQEISARFHAETGAPLVYVVSSMWLGGNIGHYSADHPRTLIDGDPRRAPWIDLGDLAVSGGVVVWSNGDPYMIPEPYVAVASNAAVQPPLTMPMRRGNGEVTIGWGIIPPVRQAAMRMSRATVFTLPRLRGEGEETPRHMRLSRIDGVLPHRLDHLADLAEDLSDLVLAHDQRRAYRDGVAGDADHDALLMEPLFHRRVRALADSVGL